MTNISRFLWNSNIEHHILRHGIMPKDVEEVAFEDKPYVRRGPQDIYYLFGTTNPGRHLFIVFTSTKRKGEVKVVTSRDMSEAEKKFYKKRGK